MIIKSEKKENSENKEVSHLRMQVLHAAVQLFPLLLL